MTMRKIILLATIALLIYSFSGSSYATQDSISGDWTARVKDTSKGKRLWLNLRVDRDERKGGSSNWGSDMELQDFRGFDANANGPVQFNITREAGAITFDGLFQNGNGVGSFKFTPNNSF